MILQVEMVTSHFGYTEEYVLNHTPQWVNRKYRQAQREKWEKQKGNIMEGMNSILLVIDLLANKGKMVKQFFPEESRDPKRDEHKKAFVQGIWWKPQ